MILGHSVPRPKQENYEDFHRKLVVGLKELTIPGLSLMIYGSFVRGDHVPGRSDIDAVLTFADDVVINKDHLQAVSAVLHKAMIGNHVPFQVSVTDIATMHDGRFNTYDPSFKPYFNEEGKIVLGPDYRNEFRYEFPIMSEQTPVRFNLRKSRAGLLFSTHDRECDYEEFLRKFNRTLDSVSRGSKQVLQFMDGGVRKNRFSGIEGVVEQFPEVDVSPLKTIKGLYQDTDRLDALYRNPEEVISLWRASLDTFEGMIKAYLKRNLR